MAASRRMLVACLAVCLAGVVAGCGTTAARPEAPIQLTLSGPSDGTRVTSRSVLVSGTVSPAGATVLVGGRSVPVSGGSFQTRVTLTPGQNIVDVLAGASRARPAMTAVRVFRQVDVTVPSLTGSLANAAVNALRARGLRAKVVDNEPFYSFLLPGSPAVCNTSPPAGRSVPPDTVVTVNLSKSC